MTLSITNAQAIIACDSYVDSVDAGAGAGVLTIYDGTIPTNVDTALSSNTVLAVLPMSDPAFGAAVDSAPNATATANAITTDFSADASGTASFFRIADSDGNAKIQGSCTASGGGGDMIISPSLSLVLGADITVSSLTVTVPE